MNAEFDNLKLLIQQTICDILDNNNLKILGKHSTCSNCQIALTRDNYKKDRSICKKFLNDNVMYYIKKRYDNQSSDMNNGNNNKKDNYPNYVSIKNNKEVISTKSENNCISIKNNKKDASTNIMTDIDPHVFLRNYRPFTIKISSQQKSL